LALRRFNCCNLNYSSLLTVEKEWNGVRVRSIGSFWKSKKGDKDVSVISSPTTAADLPDPEALAISQRPPLPIITERKLTFPKVGRIPRQAWVENLDAVKETKLGMIDLHPDIFGAFPHMDLIAKNIHWQRMYKHIDWRWAPTRAELPGTGKKPWPQKGLGKARHGSRRSPIFYKGGSAHGPRGPTTYFYMLPFYARVNGLISALSIKFAQDDLKIVDTLDIPSQDPKFLHNLVDERKWGVSVLFIDDTDLMPTNITMATDTIGQMNLMPVYGLNVFSMLKHETLVLTLAAVNRLEEKLLYHLHRNDSITPAKKFIG